MDNHALYNLLDDIVTLILLIYVLNWLNVRQQTFQGHYKRTIKHTFVLMFSLSPITLIKLKFTQIFNIVIVKLHCIVKQN